LEEKKNGLLELQNQVHERVEEIAQRQQSLIVERAQMAIDHTIALERSIQIHEELVELEIQLVEAESELEHLNEQSQRVRNMLKQREQEIREYESKIKQQHDLCKRLVKEFKAVQQRLAEMENGDEISDIMTKWLSGEDAEEEEGTGEDRANRTPDDLEADIVSTRQRIELLHEGNPRALEQFEKRARDIEKVKNDIANFQTNLEALNRDIEELRSKWEPELDELVELISAAFAHNFERIGCAGQVSVRKDPEDFREWAIQIEVKFRENEEFAILDSHRQSGGERAVSTIFYLMALQSMARSPFRVVDEINQGMDPRNERMVHERMVDIACSENTSQYFLVTPKLLNGLKYHPRMVVHVIYSGDEMPANEGEMEAKLDFKYLAELAMRMGRVH
jgi:chromosome segregation ATPase